MGEVSSPAWACWPAYAPVQQWVGKSSHREECILRHPQCSLMDSNTPAHNYREAQKAQGMVVNTKYCAGLNLMWRKRHTKHRQRWWYMKQGWIHDLLKGRAWQLPLVQIVCMQSIGHTYWWKSASTHLLMLMVAELSKNLNIYSDKAKSKNNHHHH